MVPTAKLKHSSDACSQKTLEPIERVLQVRSGYFSHVSAETGFRHHSSNTSSASHQGCVARLLGIDSFSDILGSTTAAAVARAEMSTEDEPTL